MSQIKEARANGLTCHQYKIQQKVVLLTQQNEARMAIIRRADDRDAYLEDINNAQEEVDRAYYSLPLTTSKCIKEKGDSWVGEFRNDFHEAKKKLYVACDAYERAFPDIPMDEEMEIPKQVYSIKVDWNPCTCCRQMKD